jgi:hypothetical protein
MSELGFAPHIVQAELGHMPGGLFGTYSKYNFLAEKREALELLGEHVREIVNGVRGEDP